MLPQRLRKSSLEWQVTKESLESLEVEWRIQERPKTLLRAQEAGRLQVPLEMCPLAPVGVRMRCGLLVDLGMQSAHQTGLFSETAAGAGAWALQVMLTEALGRSYSWQGFQCLHEGSEQLCQGLHEGRVAAFLLEERGTLDRGGETGSQGFTLVDRSHSGDRPSGPSSQGLNTPGEDHSGLPLTSMGRRLNRN